MSKRHHGYWERETSDPGDKRPPAPPPPPPAMRLGVIYDAVDMSALARACMERDEAIEQRDRARALACRLEEELALIRRALSARREHA